MQQFSFSIIMVALKMDKTNDYPGSLSFIQKRCWKIRQLNKVLTIDKAMHDKVDKLIIEYVTR